MARLRKGNYGDVEQTVLIEVVEFPEKSQQRREFSVRTIVRLHTLNHCPHVKAQRPNPPLQIVKLRSIASQRESELASVGRGIFPGLVDGNSVDQMV
jgi:hypothetical protein